MNIITRICNYMNPDLSKIPNFEQLREKLINSIFFIILFLGAPIIINAIVSFIRDGWKPVFELYILGLAMMALVIFYKNKLSTHVRSVVFISILTIIGIMVLISHGLGGAGILILAGLTIMTAGLWGTRAGMLIFSISLLSIIAISLLVSQGVLNPHQNQAVTHCATPWVLAIIAFSMFGLCSVKAAGTIQRYISQMLYLVSERNEKILETNKVLIERLYELRRHKQIIKRNDEEKTVVLKELHHRVKNNLQIIQSLLALQSKQVEDPQTVTIFEESCNRIRSLAWVHEELYHTNNFAYVNVGPYMNRLVLHLKNQYLENYTMVDINLNVHNIELTIDKAIPCGLIVNELVSNALRHAFINKTQFTPVVDITLYELSDQIILNVSDNGVGLPYDIDVTTTESLGLQLVRVLSVDQLNGSMKITRNGGTHYTIKFIH